MLAFRIAIYLATIEASYLKQMDTARQVARPMDIRLRYGINTHLEDEGLATPAVISAALERGGSPVIRRQWRDGDLCQATCGEQAADDITDPSTPPPTFSPNSLCCFALSVPASMQVDGSEMSFPACWQVSPDNLAEPQAIADHLGLAVRLDGLGLLPWLAARHEQGAGLSTQGRRRVAANVGR